jgi:hypothetical protein
MKPYGKEARLQGAQQATAAKHCEEEVWWLAIQRNPPRFVRAYE